LKPTDIYFNAEIPEYKNLVPMIETPGFKNDNGKFYTISDEFNNPKININLIKRNILNGSISNK